ncbi:MAG: phosphatidate cytidylyltransferase [Alistipes sp.]|nr:phosphatidate cytidylyltransferase [Alistipes sp.]
MGDKLKNFLVRTASGAVLLGIVLAAIFSGVWGYGALLLAVTILGVWEFYGLARAKGSEPQRCMGMLMSLALFFAGFVASLYIYEVTDNENALGLGVLLLLIFTMLLVIIFVIEVFRNRQTPIYNIATTIMGAVYVALPMAILTILPSLLNGLIYRGDAWIPWVPWVFLFYLLLVWGNDVFAYLVGVTMGKHRMCERLSPKKSWEGFVGGVMGSAAVGAIAASILGGSYGVWIGLAIVVALSSVVGDLIESMFKRDAGVKDSGAIMPGHGGILDRFDALIISAPFALIYLCVIEMLEII